MPRARFTPEEVVQLTLDFYRRNVISGLFPQLRHHPLLQLHHGADDPVAQLLRETAPVPRLHPPKTIPDADPEIIAQAVSMPTACRSTSSCHREQPDQAGAEKNGSSIRKTMGNIRLGLEEAEAEAKAPRFAPAGQSTQMIVGPMPTDDRTILDTAQNCTAPIASSGLLFGLQPHPGKPGHGAAATPPLLREHRLYQADFLMRGYGFQADELPTKTAELPLDVDPKLGLGAAQSRHLPAGSQSRRPGADRPSTRNRRALVQAAGGAQTRAAHPLRRPDRLKCSVEKARPFIVTQD